MRRSSRLRRLAPLLGLLAVARPLVAQTAAPDRGTLVARLDSLVRAYRADGRTVGLTVGVVRGSDTLLLRGYGWADSAARRSAEVATVYRIGSITKQYTSAAILQLIQDGKIALTDTLGRFLPQYPQWGRVTIRQLLGHTSGIHSYTANPTWAKRMADPFSADSLLAFVARDTFDFAPGTGYRYNNTGYFLLGQVLERVSRTAYPELLRTRFFGPLGMRTATYCPDEPAAPVHSAVYDRTPAGIVPAQKISMTSPYAAGAVCLSVPDFLRWQTALTGGRVVTPETYARMTRSDTLANGNPTNYGWGLAPAMLGSHPMVQHGGDIPGGSAQQMWLPNDSLRVVVFTNTLGSGPGALARNLAAAVVGEPLRSAPPAPREVALPSELRDAVVGAYVLTGPGGKPLPLVVKLDGARLVAQPEGQGAMPLTYIGDDTFGVGLDAAIRLRFAREGGKVTRVTLLQGGQTIEGIRAP
ncbi:serine hydrolase domain-containing protein [Roseisolibacter agri]|uniref:serine hydrolase domain-containing protein n=1 Tax=Roseisolibacter agri TaxID=2014610 RepID=UPI0024E0992E|nr:serine hydrolase domain-containing protein [Roseisolibacter agri]